MPMNASGPSLVNLADEPGFVLGGHQARPSTREWIVAGQPQVLEPRIMQVLTALARRRGEVVSRTELADTCWGGRAVSEDAINRCIQAIRRLAEASGGFSVTTVVRVGYRLEEKVPTVADAAPEPAEHNLSICVLPFANMSADAEQEYFSDGISEDIITDLSKVSVLSVVVPRPAFTLKGKAVDVRQVGEVS